MTSDQIEDEIERTRDEMATTLDAIERRLSPKQLMDQVVDVMKDFTNDQSRTVQIVKDNPIPLAMIGVGLGWLAVAGTRAVSTGGSSPRANREQLTAWDDLETPQDGVDGYGYAPGVDAPITRADTLDHAFDGDDKRRIKRHLAAWEKRARSSVRHAASTTRSVYNDNPLAMGLVAALVGAAIGVALPRSRVETETLGGAGAELARHARRAGSNLAEKAERIVERAAQAARDEGEVALREETGHDQSRSSGVTH